MLLILENTSFLPIILQITPVVTLLVPVNMYKLPDLLAINASLIVDYELDLILAYDALVVFQEVLQSVANFGKDVNSVCFYNGLNGRFCLWVLSCDVFC